MLANGERLLWAVVAANPARRGLHLRVPALRSGHDTRARGDLTTPGPRPLVLFVVCVLGRRLSASLQYLRVAGTGLRRDALAQLEQDPPLVAEVEHVRDGAAGLEVEVAQASGGAA